MKSIAELEAEGRANLRRLKGEHEKNYLAYEQSLHNTEGTNPYANSGFGGNITYNIDHILQEKKVQNEIKIQEKKNAVLKVLKAEQDKQNAILKAKQYKISHTPSSKGNAVKAASIYSGYPINKLDRDIEWIAYESGSLPYGFMSYFGTTLNIQSDGIYYIYMEADDEGTLYINGKKIGSSNLSKVSEYKVKLDTGIYGITVSVKNLGKGAKFNPSSLALFVRGDRLMSGISKNGDIVLSTNTNWKSSSHPIYYKSLPGISIDEKKIEQENKIERNKYIMLPGIAIYEKESKILKAEKEKKNGVLKAEQEKKLHNVQEFAKNYNEQMKIKGPFKVISEMYEHKGLFNIKSNKNNVKDVYKNPILYKNKCIDLSGGTLCNKGSIKEPITNVHESLHKSSNIKSLPSKINEVSKSITTYPLGEESSSISIPTKVNEVSKSIATYPSGEESYSKPNDLINIENKHSSIVSEHSTSNNISKGNKFINDIKKYWWVGLLFVGHVI